jgi:hypothetical protein
MGRIGGLWGSPVGQRCRLWRPTRVLARAAHGYSSRSDEWATATRAISRKTLEVSLLRRSFVSGTEEFLCGLQRRRASARAFTRPHEPGVGPIMIPPSWLIGKRAPDRRALSRSRWQSGTTR